MITDWIKNNTYRSRWLRATCPAPVSPDFATNGEQTATNPFAVYGKRAQLFTSQSKIAIQRKTRLKTLSFAGNTFYVYLWLTCDNLDLDGTHRRKGPTSFGVAEVFCPSRGGGGGGSCPFWPCAKNMATWKILGEGGGQPPLTGSYVYI